MKILFTAPPKRPELTILSTTTDEITLRLERDSEDLAPIHGYKLFYKIISEITEFQEVNVNSSDAQSYRISDCKCGSPYEFYTRGYNEYECG